MKKDNIVRIKKIGISDNPLCTTPKMENYIPGEDNGEVSLPVEYTMLGRLMTDVVVGRSLVLDRFERNGIKIPGLCVTSEVKKIENDLVFTLNSIYEVEQIQPNE